MKTYYYCPECDSTLEKGDLIHKESAIKNTLQLYCDCGNYKFEIIKKEA